MSGKIVTIAYFTNIFEAELAKGFLEDSGFKAVLQSDRFLEMIPALAEERSRIELQVSEEDAAVCTELMQSLNDNYITEQVLKEEKALLTGHFRLTSGNHSDRYIEKIKVLQNPEAVSVLCSQLTKRLKGYNFDTVIGPAYGAIVLAYEVAKQLGKRFVFAQRIDGQMAFRSGFDVSKIGRAVVIEDIVSTGGSVKEVIDLAEKSGIPIVAVGLLVDRSGGRLDLDLPVESLLYMDVPLWSPEECPLCKQGVPLKKPGSSDKS